MCVRCEEEEDNKEVAVCVKKNRPLFLKMKRDFFFLIYLSQGFDRNDCNFFIESMIFLYYLYSPFLSFFSSPTDEGNGGGGSRREGMA